jgi:thiol-disulfide isomerase/thioredoxin
MKLTFFLILTATVLIAGAQQNLKEQFILDGKIMNMDAGCVYLSYINKNGDRVRDSSEIKNGSFQFIGFISEPTLASFSGKVLSSGMDDPNYTSIFLEPARMKMTVTANEFKTAKLTGSKTQQEYEILQKQTQKVSSRWKTVMDTLSAANKRSNFEYQELRSWVLKPYFAEMREIDLAFFNGYPASYVTAYMLRIKGRDLTTDSLKMFYNRLPPKVRESIYGKDIAAQLERRKLGVVGSLAQDFTAYDIDSIQLSLSEFKGKYVLLDFWGSWCLPCRKLNPHLKDLYAEYKAKGFEIIGISDDDRNHQAWRKAVEDDKLPWRHVLRGMKIINGIPDRSKDIAAGYNVSSYPTHILINPAGEIIGRYGEDGEEHDQLDNKLKAIFKN